MKKTVKNLITWSPSHLITSPKSAFTLAEVLITLAIIGVVAAITIPTLTANYKKKVIETRLAKFYSTINQAMKLSSVDNGPINTWNYFTEIPIFDENGNEVSHTSSGVLEWFNKYIAPYIKTLKVEELDYGVIMVYFMDGSCVRIGASSTAFYPFANDYKGGLGDVEDTGIKRFLFMFDSFPGNDNFKYHHNKGLEPYMGSWDGTREQLFTKSNIGCQETVSNERAYCTKLIQLNNWKIPKDYPLKF